jgi:poly-beta-hydroxyalkanoate depolymerase
MGRQLLTKDARDHVLALQDPWMVVNVETHQDDEDALWWDYLKYENNIEEDKKDAEQLVVKDQVVYECPICELSFSGL